MSKTKDKAADRMRTRKILAAMLESDRPGTNWLGHGLDDATSLLDAMLLAGATRESLEAVRGAIDEHIWHLEHEHDLSVERTDGVYRIQMPN